MMLSTMAALQTCTAVAIRIPASTPLSVLRTTTTMTTPSSAP